MAGFFNGEAMVYQKNLSTQSAAEMKLLSASTGPDLKANQGGGDLIIEEGTLSSSGPFNDDSNSSQATGEISVHTVRPCTPERCETLSHIAEMYGVSINTILWANDIKDPKSIQAGDTLVILPITGVRHVVKSGETLESIAKKYGAENTEEVEGIVGDILSYNRLVSRTDITVGDTVVVPGGVIRQAPQPSVTKKGSTPTRTTGSSSAAGFIHPVPSAIRTQGIHGYNGVDLAAAVGTAIRASASGEVIVSKNGGWNGGYGTYVVIKHANGTQTLYAHNSSNVVGVGARVGAGETIGYVGSTGRSTGAHVHFEVRGASNPF